MPQRITIRLEGKPPHNSFQYATALRAVVLNWLRAADPELSGEIHDANQTKPLTIGPLRANREGDHACGFEIAVLADEIAATLCHGISISPDRICLAQQTFHIRAVQQGDIVRWQDLLAGTRSAPTEYELEMLSPTAHHAAGELRKSIVLPDPELYFGSWLGRWNTCCEWKFPLELREVVARQVAVTWCEGGTRTVRLDPHRIFIGFQGRVRFSLLKPQQAPEGAAEALFALMRFAEFCGTGVDTMRGMGQTRYLQLGR